MIAYCGFTHANSSVRATRRNLRDLYLRCILYRVCRADFGAMAQLVAHLHGMERVRGSNPLSSTDRVSGDFRKPFFHIQNPKSKPASQFRQSLEKTGRSQAPHSPKTSIEWKNPPTNKPPSIPKPPVTGENRTQPSTSQSRFLQSLEHMTR